jgi:transcriptional regulator with XRE-family HTH domain
MNSVPTHPAEGLLTELGRAIAARRVASGLTQAMLAARAGVSKRTVERAESGCSIQSAHLVQVMDALQLTDEMRRALMRTGHEVAVAKRVTRRRAIAAPPAPAAPEPTVGRAANDWPW